MRSIFEKRHRGKIAPASVGRCTPHFFLDIRIYHWYTTLMEPNQLTKWRKDQGYTQSELGQKLGVTKTTVYRWEKGMREIPSFLHLALRCLELEGGEARIRRGNIKKVKEKGKHGKRHL